MGPPGHTIKFNSKNTAVAVTTWRKQLQNITHKADKVNLRDGMVERSEAIKEMAGDARQDAQREELQNETGSDNQKANRSESRQEMWEAKTKYSGAQNWACLFSTSSLTKLNGLQTMATRPPHAAN